MVETASASVRLPDQVLSKLSTCTEHSVIVGNRATRTCVRVEAEPEHYCSPSDLQVQCWAVAESENKGLSAPSYFFISTSVLHAGPQCAPASDVKLWNATCQVPTPDKELSYWPKWGDHPWPCPSHHPMAFCEMICAQGRGGNGGFPVFSDILFPL